MVLCRVMGLLFVIFFWGAAGAIVAGIGALALRTLVIKLTQGSVRDRTRVIRLATYFPLACLVWVGATFIVQGVINETYLDRDFGIGDSARCPLLNDYELIMVDVGDQGTLSNPHRSTTTNGASFHEDSVSGVRNLQIADRYILGASDTRSFQHFAQSNPGANNYFLLDTQSGRREDFTTEELLQQSALKYGIQVKMDPVAKIYQRYRFTWFDIASAVLAFLPPLIGIGYLIQQVLLVKSTRDGLAVLNQPAT
jgi:hypothetical protein